MSYTPWGVSIAETGAKGDDSANDTAAIQAAIVASNGKRVFAPAGTYKTDTWTAEYALKIVGEGAYKTIFKKRSNVVFADLATAYNTFEDCSFDMVGATYTSTQAFTFSDVADLAKFEDCSFDNIPTGVAAVQCGADQAKHLRLQNCVARGVGATSILFKQTGSDTSAQQRRLTGCDAAGMRLFDVSLTQATQVTDCLATDFVIGSDSTLGLLLSDCNISGDVTLKGIRTVVVGGRYSGTVTYGSGLTYSTVWGLNAATIVDNTTSTDNLIWVQGGAIADATDAPSVITQLNALLAALRTQGVIAT